MKLNPIMLAVLAVPSLALPLQVMGAPATTPLFLTTTVTPNIFFQVDDSGSMDWTILTKKYWHGCAYDPDFGSYDNDSGDCGSVLDDGNYRSYDDDNNTFRDFYYVYDSPDDVYSNGCGGTRPAVENCTDSMRPWDADWRVRSAAVNVLYYDPSVTYAPWPGMTNASFTAARSNPKNGETGYTQLRDLTNMVFEVAIDDSGFSGTRPRRGTNRNKTAGANGLIDLWDSHTTVKFTSSGAEITTTTYAPTNTDIGDSVSAVTTLSGSSTHAALGGLTVDQAKQNFANWYQYHRRRSFVTKAAISQVITDSPNYRYGLGLINNTLFVEMPAASVTNYTTHNASLLDGFFSYNWQGLGTPLSSGLQRAGDYYRNTLTGKPTPITQSCQQNFTVLITDGYSYNENLPVNDSDGDGYSDSLADVAHYYYVTDLSSLTDDVPTNAFDTATHQHMVTFGVAFGVQGNLSDTDGDGWPNPAKTEASDWGDPSLLDSPEKIDDLWHAAYNSRGTYIAAQSPADVVSALSGALANIQSRIGSASSVATNSSSLNTGSRVYQARFDGDGWSGQLLSFTISQQAVIAPSAEWNAGDATHLGAQVGTNTDSRKIITKGSSDGVDFQDANLTLAQNAYLDADGSGAVDNRSADRVAYLRGHSQHEGTATGTFRQRPISKLGDIVNSSPWYLGAPSAGYSDLDHPGYAAFYAANINRKPVVYVGANDGMLHGFDASVVWSDTDSLVDSDGDGIKTNDHDVSVPDTNSGKEVLGYVPTPVYPNLSRLSDQNYNANHRYFVDGSPMVADACVANCATTGTWKSVLVGSLGAGGKGYFALDVSNSTGFTNAANTLLWEFTASDDDYDGNAVPDGDLGLTYNLPASDSATQQAKQIVKMENGKWAAVLGNGYFSTNGKPVIYILFLEDGEDGVWTSGDYVKIVADSAANWGNNGLSTPTPFDSDGNGMADTIYAGDLKGNMWKFDVSAANAASWAVAYSNTPLFVAQDSLSTRQPIVAPPEVTLHPASGMMVLFGTGKYIESTDAGTSVTQSFYGIQDNNSVVAGRSSLNPQNLTTTTISGVSYPTITPGTPAATPKGWYTDLPISGERVTGVPKLEDGVIFYNTFVPSGAVCGASVSGRLMTQDYLTGGLPSFSLFDTNGDGFVTSSDTIVAGFNAGAVIGGSTLISAPPGGTGAIVSSNSSGGLNAKKKGELLSNTGRVNWREILR
ncbi:MAG: PilC/PilY family type IV pilus protein [Thiobacillus sp.]|nr:PilC/PilY family type IV pilus protein [Thiobacillus sp.]